MERFDIAIAGAGAAGLLAAISSAREGMKVIIIEKMERAGRKILITGKGRCNITNTKSWDEFSTYVHPNPSFFKFAFKSFSNKDVQILFEELGLNLTVERGDRVYPLSGNAADVVDVLVKEAERLGVLISYKSRLIDVKIENQLTVGVVYETLSGLSQIEVGAVILATGGLSYPSTGSSGDGYLIAESVGHKTSRMLPSLTALMPVNYDLNLKGLVLKNISVKLLVGKDVVQGEFGDAEFTNNGFEGPIGLRISRRAVKAISDGNKVNLIVDLKPALSNDQLINRIMREFGTLDKLKLKDLLKKLLPSQLVPHFLFLLKMGDSKILSTKLPGEIYVISDLIKNWNIKIESFTGFERCVITAGGVELSELIPKTMGSRIVKNLFFAGEIIDLDGDTGGYNLQIAFSTGFLAGKTASYFIKKSNNLE